MVLNKFSPTSIITWIGIALLTASSTQTFAQTSADSQDGTAGEGKLHIGLALGPAQSLLPQSTAAGTALPFFTAGINSFGKTIPITFVGGALQPGAGTTTIPVTLVPLIVNFLDGSGTLDATVKVANTLESPVFTPVDFVTGGTDLGIAQYGDAVQRAQFWFATKPGGVAPDYHVVLGTPTVLPAQIINVPVGKGHLGLRRAIPFGTVDIAFWEATIVTILNTIGATPDQLPVFLAYNIGLTDAAPGFVLGYHNSTSGQAGPFQTWIYASWLDHGLFGGGFEDVLGLTHEVNEWLNDPFVGALFINQVPGINWVAPYQLPGQAGACQVNFEVGDAVEALANGGFAQVGANGFTYHLQDAPLLWWFVHTVPSPAVNGFYTFKGIFNQPSTLCGPG